MTAKTHLKPTLTVLAVCGTLGLAACGDNGHVLPATQPTPTPTPAPLAINGWVGYGSAAGTGTVWYDSATGDHLQNGTDDCAVKPVALDIRPGDGALMGMSADGKLMTIDPAGACSVVDTGGVGARLAALGEPVIGFAVNPEGVYAVLADDGQFGRVITFKLGDADFKSDVTLWTGVQAAPTLAGGRAFGIDFLDTAGNTNTLIVAARQAVVPGSDECGYTHQLTYLTDGSFQSDTTGGGKSCYSRYNPGNNDIAIANGVMYVHEGNSATSAGYIVNFDPITHVQARYNTDNYVLWLDQANTVNPLNTALAVRFPAN